MRTRSVLLGLGCVLVAASWWLPVRATADAPQNSDAALVAATPSPDAEDTPAPIKPSDKKGKYWFKKTCKSCHGKNGEGGELTPMSKTMNQWKRFFKKGIHKEDEKLEATFDREKLIHIEFFLIHHAADSDQPETCG